jgi:molybdate transport system substrate-binding protein
MKRSLVANLAFVALLLVAGAAHPAEIRVLCANGMQTVMEDLTPKFERATGHKLLATFASGGATIQRVRGGEPADVVIAPHRGLEELAKDGKTSPDAVTPLASSGISVAVRAGAQKPDISSPDALQRTLLAAKSITYLDPADGGASGIHFAKVLERLGIAKEMKSKTVFAPKAGAVGELVANGEAEIGVIQYQLLFSVPGIEIVGSLPGDLQDTTVFSAVILSGARDVAAARSLINFFHAPEGTGVIKAKGMEPGSP